MSKDVDRRVRIVAELLRGRESLSPSNSHNTDNPQETDTEEYLIRRRGAGNNRYHNAC